MEKYRPLKTDAINNSGRPAHFTFAHRGGPLPDVAYDCQIPDDALRELRRPRRAKMLDPHGCWLFAFGVVVTVAALLAAGVIVHSLPLGIEKPVTVALTTPQAPTIAPPPIVRRADPVLFRLRHPDGTWDLAYSQCTIVRAEILAKYSMKAIPIK